VNGRHQFWGCRKKPAKEVESSQTPNSGRLKPPPREKTTHHKGGRLGQRLSWGKQRRQEDERVSYSTKGGERRPPGSGRTVSGTNLLKRRGVQKGIVELLETRKVRGGTRKKEGEPTEKRMENWQETCWIKGSGKNKSGKFIRLKGVQTSKLLRH